MKLPGKFQFRLMAGAIAATLCTGVAAQQSKDGYMQDGRGVIARTTNIGDPKIG